MKIKRWAIYDGKTYHKYRFVTRKGAEKERERIIRAQAATLACLGVVMSDKLKNEIKIVELA